MRFTTQTAIATAVLLLFTTATVSANKIFQVQPGSNIADKVAAAAIWRDPFGAKWSFDDVKFAIKSLVVPENDSDPIDLDLRPVSSFDEHSTYSLGDGEDRPVVLSKQVLVSTDPEDVFSVLTVDLRTQGTHGFFSEKKTGNNRGKVFTLSQERGKDVDTVEAAAFKPPAWHCGVDDFTTSSISTPPKGDENRLLQEFSQMGRAHHHHHHGENDLFAVGQNLRGSKGNLGRRLYYTDNYPKAYTYQVDLFIEVDQAFVDNHGSYQAALEYIDVLFSAASAIYEQEIDTHLHVRHVEKTNRYDSAASTGDALKIMRTDFAGSSWHYGNIDLHHALLGNKLGGGIAYVGALCNSQYGFGLSANLVGNFDSLGASTVWDLTVVAHEIGHNFDSGHTHSAYSPSVDTCGSGCPSGDVPDGSGTIMSYCHQCGGMPKVSYTFGGNRDESGNWQDADLVGTVSNNPSRVAEKMHQHVSSRGSCLLPTHDVPDQECGGSTCDDNDACTLDSCLNDACANTPITCDDGNACTEDSCNSNSGCLHTPRNGASSFELIINTDNYGSETTWELFSSDMAELVASGEGYTSSSTFTIEETICSHPCFTFVIKDAWGDGMCCGYGNGGYTISIDGGEIHSGGDFGTEESFDFCLDVPEDTSAPSSLPTPIPTSLPSASPTASPISQPKDPADGWVEIFFNDFEAPNQWGNFIDGQLGDGDARRYGGGIYVHSGVASLKLRDNSGMASSVYTNDFDVSQYQSLRVGFFFYAKSMDTPKEDFFLEYSTDGLNWEVVNSWAKDIDFDNDIWYEIVQEFDARALDTLRLRFRCDATGNGDAVFIDDVSFSGKN
mmetsp:Transcript_21205/g.47339  ORF Transcript_21205/g.47339 Transcript_21205/m.47339 type:complete len:836 (+) Transcript_21205:1393-3900(+)